MASASIQFILVHIERETLEQLMDESDVQTLDSIPLEKIRERVRTRDGAEIASQIGLAVVSGFEAKMTLVESGHHESKNLAEENNEQARRETAISVMAEVKRVDGNRLGARFVYDRTVTVEEYVTEEEEAEEESTEQKFSLSSGIVLQVGQVHVAGANLNEDGAVVLLIKADF